MNNHVKQAVSDTLTRLNDTRGKGMIAAIVWGTRYAGLDQSHAGVVVRQMQYGMDSRQFHYDAVKQRVHFLGRKAPVELPAPPCVACGEPLGPNHDGIVYTNSYEHCGQTWEDTWCCEVDTECPVCHADISPSESEVLNEVPAK